MKKIIGITLGDPAGIGPEIILKALHGFPEIYNHCTPIVFGHAEILTFVARKLSLPVTIRFMDDFSQVETIAKGDVACLFSESGMDIPVPGEISARCGKLSYRYLTAGVQAAMEGRIRALVTAPIHKAAWRKAEVPYLDHTGALRELTGSTRSMTMFQTGRLRIFFYSRHVPLAQVPETLTTEKLFNTIGECVDYLRQLGVSRPRLAVAALNPHAGDQGLLGSEEQEIIEPAIMRAQKAGLRVAGPVPADAVFFRAANGDFDGVLSLYHDQGHIAAKTLDFYGTVSFTLGLPFLRTSVDHGTAMDIAGKNKADTRGMVNAILAAAEFAR